MGESDIRMEENAMAEDNIGKDESPAGQSDSGADMSEPGEAGQTQASGENAVGQEETAEEESAAEEDLEENAGQEESPEEENAAEETEDSQGGDGKEKKKVFGKSKRKDKKDEALKEKITELEDRVVRQMAEFENFRKRTEKEKSAMFETGAKSVIEKILPVVDNFERGLAAIPEEEKGNPFADGMNMIYKQLMTELEAIGVKPIEAVGCEFDPKYHNAVMQVESEGMESGMVAQELQKGYMYRDTVVRHSMVGVTP